MIGRICSRVVLSLVATRSVEKTLRYEADISMIEQGAIVAHDAVSNVPK